MHGRFRFAWCMAVAALVSSTAVAEGRSPLAKGDAAPEVAFVDITGESTDTASYRDWVQVLSFADRESSEELKKWLRPAQLDATSAHPELRVVYVTFADVSAIPRLLRRVVRPMLAKTFENSNEDLAEAYREIGIEPSPDKVELIFAPDWDGTHLKTFGLEDAKTYYLWIVANGHVIEALDASTPNLVERYAAAFDTIAPASTPLPADTSATPEP